MTPKVEQLFKPNEFPKGWTYHCAEKGTKLSDIWKWDKTAKDEESPLVCMGKPFGYIRTLELYDNYEFKLEWMYPKDPNGNSGILIHTSGADKIWPKAIQVQLHGPTAGSIFPGGGAKTANRVNVKAPQLAVNQWHQCVITSKDGTISVAINGKKTGEVTGCDPSKGAISLQSEGSEIHFRRIQLRKSN